MGVLALRSRIWSDRIVSGSTPESSKTPPKARQRAHSGLGAFPPQPRLSDRVAADIVRTIIAHDLRPGDALPPERELREQFGVSRTVVREAVRTLDARGILEVRVGSRIKVAAVDPDTVRDAVWHFGRTATLDASAIATVRCALEAAAARAAAEHATSPELELIERSATAAGGSDPSQAELGFRRAVAAASHNDLLVVLTESVAGLIPAGRPPVTTLAGRRAVAAAIADRDPDRAERAMRELVGRPAGADTDGA
jgi:GntR family transcriptional regulator, transcriptional repressor for pyruvate dehydrogenase complex